MSNNSEAPKGKLVRKRKARQGGASTSKALAVFFTDRGLLAECMVHHPGVLDGTPEESRIEVLITPGQDLWGDLEGMADYVGGAGRFSFRAAVVGSGLGGDAAGQIRALAARCTEVRWFVENEGLRAQAASKVGAAAIVGVL